MPRELDSRAVAEAARERVWRGESFLRDLFLGRLRIDLLETSVPEPDVAREAGRSRFEAFYRDLSRFLRDAVDPVEIDATGEIPPEVIDGLRRLGAFGMKIPTRYGGLGFDHAEYVRAMELVGSYDGNVTALLSAHQSIGVPQPVLLFGTEEQKQRFLPRCAAGAISAFALTEPAVGSDPARLGTRAVPTADGEAFILDGEKLWCTNGTLAELVVVMARDPRSQRINAFVVETSRPGVRVEHRCRFMGLRALANGVLSFRNVRVPRENLIGREGDGLRIALTTLNTGRLTLPAATAGAAKRCLEIVRKWSAARVQWGVPIGRHEAIALVNADIAASAFAMEALAHLVGALADRDDVDIRLEAAAAKEWNTVRCGRVLDETLQIRGGRGFETERSLQARGEPALGIERQVRDSRIDLIFEGTSEIMHLFMAREAVDPHLQLAGKLIDPRLSRAARLAALPEIVLHYAWWFPSRWLGWGRWPRYREYGPLASHLRHANRVARRLARQLFYGMIRFGAGLERRQKFLFRLVDIALEVFAMTAAVLRADHLRRQAASEADAALELADLFARGARRRIARSFRELWHNDDARAYGVARQLLDGRYAWLEQGIVGVPYSQEQLTPPTMDEILARREKQPRPAEAHTGA